jgi:hypothetical protein
MSRLHARFGDQGADDAGNLPDADGTAAAARDWTGASAYSWGRFGGINPGVALPVGINKPEQRELPSSSRGHPEQGDDNALGPYQTAPAGLYGGGELSVNSPTTKSDASSVTAPLFAAQPLQLGELANTVSFAALESRLQPIEPGVLKGDIAAVAPVSAGLHINLIPDKNNVNAPPGWAAVIQKAAAIVEQNFSDPITINLRYGYGSFRNVVDPKLKGSSNAYADTDAGKTGDYHTVAGWLLGDQTTGDDFAAYDALPDSSKSFRGGPISFTFRTLS